MKGKSALTFSNYLVIGSMLFGLFFGAGNIIFPVEMGQKAGASILPAILGFIVTGVGLPLLGIIAMGISQSQSVFQMAGRVNRKFAYFFTVSLYLVIGPLFAIPRLATVSFEVGFRHHLPDDRIKLGLLIFSVCFFLATWVLARRPGKLMDIVGKYLNPIFLGLLAIIFWFVFTQPLGTAADVPVDASYEGVAFFHGFLNGYNTLDVLASLAFGIVIIQALNGLGVTNPRLVAQDTVRSGVLAAGLMAVIYALISYMGTLSYHAFGISTNGGIALAQIFGHYLGNIGSISLGALVMVACLKTAVGLVTSFAFTFEEIFERLNYHSIIATITLLPAIFANVGLDNIVAFSIPVLMFIYPLAIALVLLVLIDPTGKIDTRVYQWTMAVACLFAIPDALAAFPDVLQTSLSDHLVTVFQTYIPLYNFGLGWLLPSIVAFIFSRWKFR